MPRNPYYEGPATDHFDGTRFFNPGHPPTDKSFADMLRWKRARAAAPWPRHVPVTPARPDPRVPGLRVTMVGHASLLIQVAAVNILVDPVWSHRASPFRHIGPARVTPPGIAFDDLPPIDAILLTHNHYDHLDTATLARLAPQNPLLVTPLGNDRLVPPGFRMEIGDWGDRVTLAPEVHANFHPAHHWSARFLRDRRMALWCGFVLQTPAGTVYLAGDTALGDGRIFRDVRETFGPPRLAILPIGAYEPRWFMRNQHANPADAVQILLACDAASALGVHWGTFPLADEARDAPPAALAAACHDAALDPGRFIAFAPAEVWQA